MDKSNFSNLIKDLPALAQKNNWLKTYDKELDYFCCSKENLANDVRAIKISNEVFLYVDSKQTIKGLGIEYLKNGFVKHHPGVKDLTQFFTEKTDENDESVLTVSPKQEKKFTADFKIFIKDLTSDIGQENFYKGRTPDDFEGLFSVAFK